MYSWDELTPEDGSVTGVLLEERSWGLEAKPPEEMKSETKTF